MWLTIRPRLLREPQSILSSEGTPIDLYAQVTLANGDGEPQAIWLKRDGTTTGELRMRVFIEHPATVTFTLAPIAKSTSTGGPVELFVRYGADAVLESGAPTTIWLEDSAP